MAAPGRQPPKWPISIKQKLSLNFYLQYGQVQLSGEETAKGVAAEATQKKQENLSHNRTISQQGIGAFERLEP